MCSWQNIWVWEPRLRIINSASLSHGMAPLQNFCFPFLWLGACLVSCLVFIVCFFCVGNSATCFRWIVQNLHNNWKLPNSLPTNTEKWSSIFLRKRESWLCCCFDTTVKHKQVSHMDSVIALSLSELWEGQRFDEKIFESSLSTLPWLAKTPRLVVSVLSDQRF